MTISSIDTELFKLDGGAMFGVVPKVIWNKLNPADDDNLCTWSMRLLLIEHGDKKILIDTGIGQKQDEKFLSHYHLHGTNTLITSLQKKGISEAEITDVVLTHLHFDHCGGAVKKNEHNELVCTFPNATYWSNNLHWQWATTPNDREKASFLKENILPIESAGQLALIQLNDDANPTEKLVEIPSGIIPQLSFVIVNGHTKAMMIPKLKTQHGYLIYMADLLPSIHHIPMPYIMAYDMFPMISLIEKKYFLHDAITHNYTLFFEHDAKHECCNLIETEKGIRVKQTFTLNQFLEN